jgi:hypothetical protein
MPRRTLIAAGWTLGLMGAVLAQSTGKASWMKLEAGKQASQATGKPILIYTTVEADGGTCMAISGSDRWFSEDRVSRTLDEFILVKVSDKKTFEAVKARNPNELIFVDPEGKELYRKYAVNAEAVSGAIAEALTKYPGREVAWGAYNDGAIERARDSRKLAIIAVWDETRGEDAALKLFEDRTVAQLQDQCVFLKLKAEKDSPVLKKLGVSGGPALLFVDPSGELGSKSILATSSGARTAIQIRALLLKSLKGLLASKSQKQGTPSGT